MSYWWQNKQVLGASPDRVMKIVDALEGLEVDEAAELLFAVAQWLPGVTFHKAFVSKLLDARCPLKLKERPCREPGSNDVDLGK